MRIRCGGEVFTEPFPSNGRLSFLLKSVAYQRMLVHYLFHGRCLRHNNNDCIAAAADNNDDD
jgi:hypothetical protein